MCPPAPLRKEAVGNLAALSLRCLRLGSNDQHLAIISELGLSLHAASQNPCQSEPREGADLTKLFRIFSALIVGSCLARGNFMSDNLADQSPVLMQSPSSPLEP